MDVRLFNEDCRAEESRLRAAGVGEYCFTTSLKYLSSTAGKVCEVSITQAAKAIVEGQARLSTDEEKAAFHVAAEARRHAMEAAELKKQPSSFRVSLRQK